MKQLIDLESKISPTATTMVVIGALTASVANNVQAAAEVPASPAPKVETFTSPAIDFINQQTDPQVIAAYCKANATKLNQAEMNAGILKFQQLTLSIMEKMFVGKNQAEIEGILAQKGNEWMKNEPYAAKGRSIYASAAPKDPPSPKPEANANGVSGGDTNAQQSDLQQDEKPAEPVKPKPPLGSKEDLALKKAAADAAKAKIDAEKEAARKAKLAPKILKEFNDLGLLSASWKICKEKDLNGEVKVKEVGNELHVSLTGGNKGRIELQTLLLPDKYILDLEIEGGKLIVWSKSTDGDDKRLEIGSGKHKIDGSQYVRFGLGLTTVNSSVKIKNLKINNGGGDPDIAAGN